MNFGAIERKQTEQDVTLGSFAPKTRPTAYMPAFLGIIENQKKTSACGAHAGQSLKQILSGFRGSPEYLWKKIKLIDGFKPEDGTDMLSILKTLNQKGICSFESMPNNPDTWPTVYTDASTITQELDSEAQLHKTGVYAFAWNPSFEDLKQAVYDHKAVILLMRVGKEFWRDRSDNFSTWKESDILPLTPWTPATSGHFVTAFAYDNDFIYFTNEWSADWGDKGIGYFGSDYSSRVVEIGTTVDSESKYIFTKVLKLGMKGFDVKMLQYKLGVIPDSSFGPQTKFAVQAFQTLNHLIADGIVGPMTNVLLNK